VAKRTKLYQRSQSPLIQGRSRIQRPAWQDGASGATIAFIGWTLLLMGDFFAQLGFVGWDAGASAIESLAGPVGVLGFVSLASAWVAAAVGHAMGWHRAWRGAAMFAAIVDLVVLVIIL